MNISRAQKLFKQKLLSRSDLIEHIGKEIYITINFNLPGPEDKIWYRGMITKVENNTVSVHINDSNESLAINDVRAIHLTYIYESRLVGDNLYDEIVRR